MQELALRISPSPSHRLAPPCPVQNVPSGGPCNDAAVFGNRRLPAEAGQNVTPGPRREKGRIRQNQARRPTTSQQEKGKPREGGICPWRSGAQGRTWSRVALVIGSAVRLAHTGLWASSRGRRLRAVRAQDSAMAGWRGTWTQAELVAGAYTDLYIEPWAEPWSPLMTQSDERL